MMKSFQESNGTVLSTNWNEVGKEKVEMKPPDSMEFKKWEGQLQYNFILINFNFIFIISFKIIKSIFLRMGIVTELLDFNKVRRFQEFCGIVATKDDDPRGIDAVMR